MTSIKIEKDNLNDRSQFKSVTNVIYSRIVKPYGMKRLILALVSKTSGDAEVLQDGRLTVVKNLDRARSDLLLSAAEYQKAYEAAIRRK